MDDPKSSGNLKLVLFIILPIIVIVVLITLIFFVKPASPTTSSNESSVTSVPSLTTTIVTPTPTTPPNSTTPTPSGENSSTLKLQNAGEVSYPSTWNTVTEIPSDLSDKMFTQPCTGGMLKSQDGKSLIVADVKAVDDTTPFCWSSGKFTTVTTRQINTDNYKRGINVAKWTKSASDTWNNDYFEGPVSLTNTGKKKVISLAFYTVTDSKEQTETDFDQILNSFVYK